MPYFRIIPGDAASATAAVPCPMTRTLVSVPSASREAIEGGNARTNLGPQPVRDHRTTCRAAFCGSRCLLIP